MRGRRRIRMTRMNEKTKEEELVGGNNYLSMFMAVAYCLRAITKSHTRTTHTLCMVRFH
jgi:hypothetical protein